MKKEKDPFEGLGCGPKIVQLEDPYNPFNPLLECDVSAAK